MRKKNEKKIRKFLLIISILSILLVGVIFAYFTDIEIASNNITMGFVDIDLEEYKDNNNSSWEDITNAMPGDTITKIVKISKKEDSANCYIRAKVEFSGDLSSFDDITEECLSISTGWTKNSDGYYYYNNELTSSDPVTFLNSFTIPINMDNTYVGKKLTITVTAEAIQSLNFDNTAPWTDGTNTIVVKDYEI